MTDCPDCQGTGYIETSRGAVECDCTDVCLVRLTSSRVCERGTKSCVITHFGGSGL